MATKGLKQSPLALIFILLWLTGLAACQQTERTFVSSTTGLGLKWNFIAPKHIRTPPLYLKNRVAIGTDSEMEGIESGSGIIVWNVPGVLAGEMSASPNRETLAFASNGSDDPMTVDAETGFVLWRRNGSVASLAVDSERVYVGRNRSDAEPVDAFRVEDGRGVWEAAKGVPQHAGAHYLFAQEDGLFSFISNNLYVFDKESGQVIRSHDHFLPGDSPRVDDVKMVENQVYMWYKSNLRVKDVNAGRVIWDADVTPWVYDIIGPRVIVGSSNMLTALDNATGEILWQKALASKPISDPVATGETGYMILDNASIIAFDLETGEDRGIIETSPALVNPEGFSKGLATDGKVLFATFGDNSLFAFGPK